jgi:chromosome segregation ATPase
MKEKLEFVEKQNAASKSELAALEAQLGDRRDRLTALKTKRDSMRAAGARMRDACVYVTSPLLLADLAVSGG